MSVLHDVDDERSVVFGGIPVPRVTSRSPLLRDPARSVSRGSAEKHGAACEWLHQRKIDRSLTSRFDYTAIDSRSPINRPQSKSVANQPV